MPRKPLKLPPVVTPGTRVSFEETDGLLLLSDRRGGRQLLLWAVGGLFVFGMVGAVLWLSHLGTLPNQHRLTDQYTLGMAVIVLCALSLFILPFVIAAKGWHRGFRVRVDVLGRTCVCSKRMFGIRLRKREVDAVYAEWDTDTVYVQHEVGRKQASAGDVVVGLLLFALGPLGWVIALLSSSGRNAKRDKTWEGRDMARLCLSERGEPVALITVPDETEARDFLLAWDRCFPAPARG